MAPKNTPPAIIATLNEDLNKVLAFPEVRDSLVRLGVNAAGGTPADFRKRIEADNATRGAIIRELGIKAD